MHSAILAFIKTATEFGQALPELAATNNPSGNLKWLLKMIPMLQQMQDKLDRLTGIALQSNLTLGTKSAATEPHKPMVTSTVSDVQPILVAASTEDVRLTILAVGEIVSSRPVGDRVIALDAEWDTKKNRAGRVVQSFKTTLIRRF
jgi:hypothetical protein